MVMNEILNDRTMEAVWTATDETRGSFREGLSNGLAPAGGVGDTHDADDDLMTIGRNIERAYEPPRSHHRIVINSWTGTPGSGTF